MENTIKKYFEQKKEIASIYLYGSFASAKQTRSSDVDIGVLFENKFLEFAEKYKEQYMVELGRLLRKDVELITMNQAGELILNQIFKKGKPILIKNEKFAKEFKIRSLALYYDFSFYLKRIQKSFMKHILDS